MSFILIIIFSFILTGVILFLNKNLPNYFSRNIIIREIQTSHELLVPRLGGLCIFVILAILFFLYSFNNEIYLHLLISSLPIFIAGILDDIKFVSLPIIRFIASLISAIIFIYLSNFYISSTSIPLLKIFLNYSIFAIAFTVFAYSGVINSFNFIDGLNGTTIILSITILFVLYFISNEMHDTRILEINLILSSVLLGIILFNFPFPKIFLGDSGAYLLGHFLFWLSILISEINSEISQWSILLFFIYPVTETVLSIIRRLISKSSIYMPDRKHIHTLVFDRVISPNFRKFNLNTKNNLASLFVLCISTPPVFTGYFFIKSPILSMLSTVIFFTFYISLYLYLLKLEIKKSL